MTFVQNVPFLSIVTESEPFGTGNLEDGKPWFFYRGLCGNFVEHRRGCNVVLRGSLFSLNVVRKWAMFLGQAIYVLGLEYRTPFRPYPPETRADCPPRRRA